MRRRSAGVRPRSTPGYGAEMSDAALTGFHHPSRSVPDLDDGTAWCETSCDLGTVMDGDGRYARVDPLRGAILAVADPDGIQLSLFDEAA